MRQFQKEKEKEKETKPKTHSVVQAAWCHFYVASTHISHSHGEEQKKLCSGDIDQRVQRFRHTGDIRFNYLVHWMVATVINNVFKYVRNRL